MPVLWRYADLRPHVLRSVDLVTPEKAGRRVIYLSNPGRQEVSAAVGWLYAGLQVMHPGETATAHRHSASAIRFIMEGEGAYTVVDGHKMTLGRNDFVLTPNGTWHEHAVEATGTPCIWQDGLDIPLVNALEANFYEVHPDLSEPVRFPTDDMTHTWGNPGLRPGSGDWSKGYSPMFKYEWDRTYEALQAYASAAEPSPFDGALMDYVNPVTGGPVMKTMGASMQMLRPGEATRAHRHTGSGLYHVAKGCRALGDRRAPLRLVREGHLLRPLLGLARARGRGRRGGRAVLPLRPARDPRPRPLPGGGPPRQPPGGPRMRLVTYRLGPDGPGRLGVMAPKLHGGSIIDVAMLGTGLPGTMLGLIDAGPAALATLSARRSRIRPPPRSCPPPTPPSSPPSRGPARTCSASASTTRAHVAESASGEPFAAPDLPDKPVIFSMPPTAVIGPGQPIEHNARITRQLDWEVELAVIIGTTARRVYEDEALDHVFGYSVIIDISARDCRRAGQWIYSKGQDSYAPFGPCIVTADEVGDPHDLDLWLTVNGVEKQRGNTGDMLFKVPALIADISAAITLEPGDIIATGTPEGVGAGRNPPEFLWPGDVVVACVEGIGRIRHPVVAVGTPDLAAVEEDPAEVEPEAAE